MSGQRRALVIGGSVGGLFAAHMLRSIGWEVVVFERSGDDLVRRGAGIGANDALFAVMRRIGVPFDASNAIALPSRVWLETNGNIAAEVPQAAASPLPGLLSIRRSETRYLGNVAASIEPSCALRNVRMT